MAQALQLRLPEAAWHTQRDELAKLAAALGSLVGSLAKIAQDIALMAQGEVGELAEGAAGGSSTMPHKRNPVGAMVALAAAHRAPQRVAALLAAMPQAHERGLGDWQAELAEFSGLLASAAGAAGALRRAAAGLQVDAARMRRNIDAQDGLVFAEGLAMRLAQAIGKAAAHHRVEAWSRRTVDEGRSLRDVAQAAIRDDEALRDRLPAADVDALFDAEAAARHASRLAQAQLTGLARQSAIQADTAPWAAWLPGAGDDTEETA
jgi:3-carboxy-cis,cis-muconate cycloisomerase